MPDEITRVDEVYNWALEVLRARNSRRPVAVADPMSKEFVS
ncbi:hypothetical protein [Nocardia terpenica]|nr:hypothetical protein [Nocardia terpenica]